MKGIVVFAAAVVLAPAAWGQLYKYVDKDGKTVYTDQPPANVESKALSAPPPAPTPAARPPAEAEKAPAKPRPEARAPVAKPEPVAESPAEKEARCQEARANYAIFLDGPVTMRNTATGERFQLDEKRAEAEKTKAKAAMDAACRKT